LDSRVMFANVNQMGNFNAFKLIKSFAKFTKKITQDTTFLLKRIHNKSLNARRVLLHTQQKLPESLILYIKKF